MQCPKCHFENAEQSTECLKCGIVFEKYARSLEAAGPVPVPAIKEESVLPRGDVRREWRYRLFALPAALIGAHTLVSIAPGAVRMLSMWIHECGHAVTAWLCGFPAFPGPWFTPVDTQRSPALSIMFVGLIGFGGFRAWTRRRWVLVASGGVVLIVQFIFTARLYSDQAQQLIIFGGDAGCFVLGSLLIATFYAGRETAIYQNSLRWGFLVIGALAYMDAFAVWSHGVEGIPFGENENGMSDPSVLTDLYGWGIRQLLDRYYHLAIVCLLALAVVYVIGLAQSQRALRAAETSSADPQTR
jgi:hypothetical protein